MTPGVFLIVFRFRQNPTEPIRPGDDLQFVCGVNPSQYTNVFKDAAFFTSKEDALRRCDPSAEKVVPLEELVTFVWPEEPQEEPAEVARQYLVF